MASLSSSVYRTGHYGAALLVYAPVGLVLYPVSSAAAVVGGAGVLALARVPDYDHRVPLLSHRGPTHTLLFLVVVAGALAAAGWLLGAQVGVASDRRLAIAALGALAGAVGIGSHLLADALTPAGVPLLWPLSSRDYSLHLIGASNPVANWGLLALGVGATAGTYLTVGAL
jgi:inner membrane protein